MSTIAKVSDIDMTSQTGVLLFTALCLLAYTQDFFRCDVHQVFSHVLEMSQRATEGGLACGCTDHPQ